MLWKQFVVGLDQSHHYFMVEVKLKVLGEQADIQLVELLLAAKGNNLSIICSSVQHFYLVETNLHGYQLGLSYSHSREIARLHCKGTFAHLASEGILAHNHSQFDIADIQCVSASLKQRETLLLATR